MFCRKEQIATGASTLFLSYMEIYKEEVYDLLVDRDNVSTFAGHARFNVKS